MKEHIRREYESRFNPFNNPEKVKKDVDEYLKLTLDKMPIYKHQVDIDKDNFCITIRIGQYTKYPNFITYLVVKYNCVDTNSYWYFPKSIDNLINQNKLHFDKDLGLYDIKKSLIPAKDYLNCYELYQRYASKIWSFIYKFYMEGIIKEKE